jgi:hypothetical protein
MLEVRGSTGHIVGAVSCGGATDDKSAAPEAIPVSGFYERTVTTLDDSCAPAMSTESFVELVATNEAGFDVKLPSTPFRQAFKWAPGEPTTLQECGTQIFYDVDSKAADSFSVAFDFVWRAPQTCFTKAVQSALLPPELHLPQSDCDAHQTVTWKLKAACPTTYDGVHCT